MNFYRVKVTTADGRRISFRAQARSSVGLATVAAKCFGIGAGIFVESLS